MSSLPAFIPPVLFDAAQRDVEGIMRDTAVNAMYRRRADSNQVLIKACIAVNPEMAVRGPGAASLGATHRTLSGKIMVEAAREGEADYGSDTGVSTTRRVFTLGDGNVLEFPGRCFNRPDLESVLVRVKPGTARLVAQAFWTAEVSL